MRETGVDAVCPASEVALRAVESWFLGGEVRTLTDLPLQHVRLAQGGTARALDPNGDIVTGQMYAQVFRLARPVHACPVVLWHGGGMTGACWESTPDGRPGWLWRFLQAGYDVVVCDAVERGRASWSRFPEVYAGAPVFRTLNDAWDMFRIGPADGYATDTAQRRTHLGVRFPHAHFDRFASQFVPRWSDHEAQTLDAYGALLARLGSCVLVGHSQGGGFVLAAAARWPSLIKAVVAIEPSGAPGPEAGLAGPLPDHLVLWGDHVAAHPVWQRCRQTAQAHLDRAAALGTHIDLWDLPAQGIHGNSHFPMMDDNSDDLGRRVSSWLAACLGEA